MLSVEQREAIRRAYYVDKKSVRQIARELHCSRKSVDKALASASAAPYTRTVPYASPKLGPFKQRIIELLAEREQQPPKQRYTSTRIYQILRAEGYQGSAARLRGYLGTLRWRQPRPRSFFPLEFDPGQDAQVDLCEKPVSTTAGPGTKALEHLHPRASRLSYSRWRVVMLRKLACPRDRTPDRPDPPARVFIEAV